VGKNDNEWFTGQQTALFTESPQFDLDFKKPVAGTASLPGSE